MGTSERTFDQVKSILGKLDRNIDVARSRRLHEDSPVPVPSTPVRSSPMTGNNGQTIGGPATSVPVPATTTAPMPSKSGFGRAQPLRRSGSSGM
jgi:hypothetical protein